MSNTETLLVELALLTKQRDELLAALERLMLPGEKAIALTADEMEADYDFARKAIASAKGGAA